MKLNQRIVRVVLRVAALSSAIIALGVGFSSLLPMPDAWQSARFTLMLGALLTVCGASYLHLYSQGERDEARDRALEARLEALRDTIAKLHAPAELTSHVRAQLVTLPRWGSILSAYASDYMLARIDSILTKDGFAVQGGFFFQDFYRAVFRSLPACKLIATADASPEYMWKSRDLNGIFEDFIKQREGALTRIFFLREEADLNDPAVREIMLGQHQADVKVYWVVRSALPEVRYMLAEEGGGFGWQLRTNARGEIEHVDVSWAKSFATDCLSYLNGALHHPATQRFKP
jgi:hypothetical protein